MPGRDHRGAGADGACVGKSRANLRKMGDFVEKICSEQKTDLIVFPELSYTGTELGLRATDLAEHVPGHASNYLTTRQRF